MMSSYDVSTRMIRDDFILRGIKIIENIQGFQDNIAVVYFADQNLHIMAHNLC